MAWPTNKVARCFIRLARRDHRRLTPLKLIKLLYFAHGWHLAIFGEPLLREGIAYGPHGPVVASLHERYRNDRHDQARGGRSLEELPETHPAGKRSRIVEQSQREWRQVQRLLEKVWETYGGLEETRLASIAHKPGSPWQMHRDEIGSSESDNRHIPDFLIEEAFLSLYRENQRTRDLGLAAS